MMVDIRCLNHESIVAGFQFDLDSFLLGNTWSPTFVFGRHFSNLLVVEPNPKCVVAINIQIYFAIRGGAKISHRIRHRQACGRRH